MPRAKSGANGSKPKPAAGRDIATAGRDITIVGLPGILIRPRGATALYVLAHGAGAGMRHWFMTDIADALAAHGIATLRWEFPYMAAGKKRVDAAPVAEQAVRDVWTAAAAHDFGLALGLARGLPRFAGGKSFGGRMTSRAHAAVPLAGVRGLIFLGFPLHPAGKPGTERAEHLSGASGPLLFVQGTRDDLADLTLLRPVVKSLGKRAALHVIDGADHGFSRKLIPDIARTIAVWIAAALDR